MIAVSFQIQNLAHDLTKGVFLGTVFLVVISLTSEHDRQTSLAFAWMVMVVYSVVVVALYERYFRDPVSVGGDDEA